MNQSGNHTTSVILVKHKSAQTCYTDSFKCQRNPSRGAQSCCPLCHSQKQNMHYLRVSSARNQGQKLCHYLYRPQTEHKYVGA
uniref:Uncharacterized protein n=1 Tax=Arundo donax TaxID=35708 RepID=A0A0A9AQ28_ARUDO